MKLNNRIKQAISIIANIFFADAEEITPAMAYKEYADQIVTGDDEAFCMGIVVNHRKIPRELFTAEEWAYMAKKAHDLNCKAIRSRKEA